jgi:hypothetical protein
MQTDEYDEYSPIRLALGGGAFVVVSYATYRSIMMVRHVVRKKLGYGVARLRKAGIKYISSFVNDVLQETSDSAISQVEGMTCRAIAGVAKGAKQALGVPPEASLGEAIGHNMFTIPNEILRGMVKAVVEALPVQINEKDAVVDLIVALTVWMFKTIYVFNREVAGIVYACYDLFSIVTKHGLALAWTSVNQFADFVVLNISNWAKSMRAHSINPIGLIEIALTAISAGATATMKTITLGSSVLKQLGSLGQSLKGVESLFTIIPKILDSTARFLYTTVFKEEYATASEKELKEFNLWYTAVLQTNNVSMHGTLIYDQAQQAAVDILYQKYMYYSVTAPYCSFTRMGTAGKAMNEIWNVRIRALNVERPLPMHTMLFGAPGAGKSEIIRRIVHRWTTKYFGVAKMNQLYQFSNTKYADGYAQQQFVLFDDLNLVTSDRPGEGDFEFLMGLVGTTPYIMDMAHLSDKGMHFNSKFIMSTTNNERYLPDYFVDQDSGRLAWARRIHLMYKMEFEWTDSDGNIHNQMTPSVVGKIRASGGNPDDFIRIIKYNAMEFLTSVNPAKEIAVFNVEQFIEDWIKCAEEHLETYDSKSQVHVKQYVDRMNSIKEKYPNYFKALKMFGNATVPALAELTELHLKEKQAESNLIFAQCGADEEDCGSESCYNSLVRRYPVASTSSGTSHEPVINDFLRTVYGGPIPDTMEALINFKKRGIGKVIRSPSEHDYIEANHPNGMRFCAVKTSKDVSGFVDQYTFYAPNASSSNALKFLESYAQAVRSDHANMPRADEIGECAVVLTLASKVVHLESMQALNLRKTLLNVLASLLQDLKESNSIFHGPLERLVEWIASWKSDDVDMPRVERPPRNFDKRGVCMDEDDAFLDELKTAAQTGVVPSTWLPSLQMYGIEPAAAIHATLNYRHMHAAEHAWIRSCVLLWKKGLMSHNAEILAEYAKIQADPQAREQFERELRNEPLPDLSTWYSVGRATSAIRRAFEHPWGQLAVAACVGVAAYYAGRAMFGGPKSPNENRDGEEEEQPFVATAGPSSSFIDSKKDDRKTPRARFADKKWTSYDRGEKYRQAQAGGDEELQDILFDLEKSPLKRNLFRIVSMEGDVDAVTGLMVENGFMLVPKHFVELHAGQQVAVTDMYSMTQKLLVFPKDFVPIQRIDGTYADLVFWNFGSTFGARASVFNQFMTDDDVRFDITRRCEGLFCKSQGRNFPSYPQIYLRPLEADFVDSREPVEWMCPNGDFERCYKYIHYDGKFKEGTCGGLIIDVENNRSNRRIMGIHIAGNRDSGLAEIITQQMIRKALPQKITPDGYALNETTAKYVTIEPMAPELMSKIKPQGLQYEHDVIALIPDANMLPGKSRIENSPFYEQVQHIFPTDKMPAILRPVCVDGQYISPLKKSIAKTSVIQSCLPVGLIKMALDDIREHEFGDYFYPCSELTREEALHGIPGEIDGLNMTSSVGYPWLETKLVKDLRKECSNETIKRRLCETKEFNDACDELLSHWRAGKIDYPCIYKAELKDEKRPAAKVLELKTRTFYNPPAHQTVVVRQLAGSWAKLLSSRPLKNFMAIGMNCESTHGTMLYDKLRNFSKVGFDYDVSGFDGSFNKCLAYELADFISSFYKEWSDHPNRVARRTMMLSAIESEVLVGNALIQEHQGNPSGFALTAVINSIVNAVFHRIGWYLCRQKAGLDTDFAIFHEHYLPFYYGDDAICAYREGDRVGPKAITKMLATLNIKFTSGSKDSTPTVQPITDLTFLQRKFVYHQSLKVHVMNLNFNSIGALLKYYTGTKVHQHKAITDNIDAALYFLALYDDPKYFNTLQEIALRSNYPVYRASYATTAKRVYEGLWEPEILVTKTSMWYSQAGGEEENLSVQAPTKEDGTPNVLTTTDARNVTFKDSQDHFTGQYMSTATNLAARKLGCEDPWTPQLLFERPIMLGTFQWTNSNIMDYQIAKFSIPKDIPGKWGQLTHMLEMMSFVRPETIKFSIQVNCNSFHCGRLLAVWVPVGCPKIIPPNTHNYVQLPHVLIDASTCRTTNLEVPFMSVVEALDTKATDGILLGELRIVVGWPLTSADQSTSTPVVDGTIYISFMQTSCRIPVSRHTPFAAQSGGKEENAPGAFADNEVVECIVDMDKCPQMPPMIGEDFMNFYNMFKSHGLLADFEASDKEYKNGFTIQFGVTPSSVTVTAEKLSPIDYFSSLFIYWKGSLRYLVVTDATTDEHDRVNVRHFPGWMKNSEMALTLTSSAYSHAGLGFAPTDTISLVKTPIFEYEVPFYSQFRKHFVHNHGSRELQYDFNQNRWWHTCYNGVLRYNFISQSGRPVRWEIWQAGGDDYQVYYPVQPPPMPLVINIDTSSAERPSCFYLDWDFQVSTEYNALAGGAEEEKNNTNPITDVINVAESVVGTALGAARAVEPFIGLMAGIGDSPAVPQVHNYHNTHTPISNSQFPRSVRSLRLNPLALTPDVASERKQESFKDLIRKPTLVARCKLTDGAINFSFPINPLLAPTPSPAEFFYGSTLAYLSWPFSLWRGSLEFKFDFVSPMFATGRLLIAWMPSPSNAAAVTITKEMLFAHPSVVVDLNQRKTVSFRIPYMHRTWYKGVPRIIGARGKGFYYDEEQCNGVLIVKTLNKIVSTSANTVKPSLWIWMRAGEDFELAVPRDVFQRPIQLPRSFDTRKRRNLDQKEVELEDGQAESEYEKRLEKFYREAKRDRETYAIFGMTPTMPTTAADPNANPDPLPVAGSARAGGPSASRSNRRVWPTGNQQRMPDRIQTQDEDVDDDTYESHTVDVQEIEPSSTIMSTLLRR